jgi:hypothetical protein
MGPVRLGMTLAALRQLVPTASIERVSDGDGAALVRVAFGQDDSLILSADEDDPDVPVDWSRRITTIETFSQTFHTVEGVRPGWLVEDLIKVFGPVREIVVSEIESREFITFENQPSWLTLRLDYAGVFPAGVRRTRQFKPGAKILGILISLSGFGLHVSPGEEAIVVHGELEISKWTFDGQRLWSFRSADIFTGRTLD